MAGFIKLYRQLQKNWLWQEKRTFSKAEAWIDILLMVNHSDNKVPAGNELILVKKGSRMTSVRKLCEGWNWSNTKVINFLNLLQNDGMITYKSDTKKTVISVVNWDLYQCINDTKTKQKRHASDTETTREHTNNNEKNEKNDENEIYSVLFEKWNSLNIIIHKELTPEIIKAIDKALKTYKQEQIELAMTRYAQIYHDKNYFFSYKWSLQEFLTRVKTIPSFLNEGSQWESYPNKIKKEDPINEWGWQREN